MMIEWVVIAVAALNALSGFFLYFIALHGLFGVLVGYWEEDWDFSGVARSAATAHWEMHLVFVHYMGAGRECPNLS